MSCKSQSEEVLNSVIALLNTIIALGRKDFLYLSLDIVIMCPKQIN